MSDTQLKKIQITPGFNKNDTEYRAENNWIDGDKFRFRNGKPQKFGGWVKESMTQTNNALNKLFTGVSRDVHAWIDLAGKRYLVQGSHKKVEILSDNRIFDITPVREINSLTNAITTVSGQSVVTITDINHNLVVGDYIFAVSQASAINGITLSGSYVVTEVVNLNAYKVNSGTVASGSSTGGGALVLHYLLQNGAQSNGGLTGYSGGPWNEPGQGGQGYNRPRAGTGGVDARLWSFDNWGEDLVACLRDGAVYRWDATLGLNQRLTLLPNAPTENLIVMVAQPSRHLVLFGTQKADGGVFDPLTIRWSESERLENWEITQINTAGEYRLANGNYIVAAVQTKNEILVFTDTALYSMRKVSGSAVFQFTFIASNVSCVSQNACIDINGIVYWMGLDGFYMYDGVVRNLTSTIDEFVYDEDGVGKLNFSQKEKVYCSSNKDFNEIIWLYPTSSSTEINRYIIYNYVERVWYDGSIDRTVWLDKGTFERPYGIKSDGTLYLHEVGKDDDGSPMVAYIKSGYFDIDDGDSMLYIDRFVPDFKLTANRQAETTLRFKKYPNADEILKGPYTFTSVTPQVNTRGRGRQCSVEFRIEAIGADLEVGAFRFGYKPDGAR